MISNQGSFTQTNPATNKFISIPSGFDWIEVFNQTKAAAAGGGAGVKFYFNPHTMTNGTGFVESKTAGTDALLINDIAAGAGFFVMDTSNQEPGASVVLTSVSNAATPVVATGNTAGLFAGDTVRLYNVTGALQLGGIDFTIDTIVANTSFELAYMAQVVAGTTGTFRKIPFNPIYYPRNRIISKITQASQAVVTLTVTHGYHVGQKIRFIIPEVTALAFGMTALNDEVVTITAIDTVNNTITVDFDTSAMTAFAWPLTADPEFTPAQIVPAGMDTAAALYAGVNIHSDASRNEAQLGVLLMAGALSPAGAAGDVISWRSGVSFTVDPE